MGTKQVSGTRTISAKPEEIFDILADHTRHPELDGSGTVRGSRRSSTERLELGSTFAMDMKMGASYKILNTVVEFEEGRQIAWQHFYGHRWRWELQPLEDGTTEVTETFDWSNVKKPWVISLIRAPQRNKRSIESTLDKLQKRFAAPSES